MRKVLSLFTMLMLTTVLAFSQAKDIAGRVIDDQNEPVAFASVKVKGNRSGVNADQNGRFTIRAKVGDQLEISFQGNTMTGTIAEGQLNTFVLPRKVSSTEAVTVITTAQGFKKKAREIGASVATVSPGEITNGKSFSIAQALSGKVAGLNITTTNSGANPSARIVLRGTRFVTGNNEALVVLDGVPVGKGALFSLNPNDIAEVTVLKGGQAATLYGSDGVNGAIIVTTKRGTRGKPQINFSSTANFEQVSFLPEFQDEFGSGSNYGAPTPAGNYRSFENQQYGDRFDGSLRPLGRVLEDGSVYTLPYQAQPGERRKVWNIGSTFTNNMSISGGDQSSRFFLSVEDVRSTAVTPKDKYQRNNLRFNSSRTFGKLEVQSQVNYTLQNNDFTNAPFYFEVLNTAPHIPLSKLQDWKNNKFANPNGYFNDYYNNPYFNLDNQRGKLQQNTLYANLQLDMKANKWLTISNRTGVTSASSSQKNYTGKFIYSNYAKNDAYVPAPFPNDYNGINRAGTDIVGGVSDNATTQFRLINDFIVSTQNDFGDFNLKTILGVNTVMNENKSISVSSNSIVIPGIYNVANRTGEPGASEFNSKTRKMGYYADASMGYKDMIFVHGSVRADQSSVYLGTGKTLKDATFVYPGVDVSFILSDLVPSIKSKNINYVKLRGAWNRNGLDVLSAYELAPTFDASGGFPYGTSAATTVGGTFPDPGLRPDFSTSYEGGVEMTLFNSRVNLELVAYKTSVDGNTLSALTAPSTGIGTLRINAANADSWGYEADLKTTLVKKDKLTWDVTLRYAYSDNKVTSLFGDLEELVLGSIGAQAQSYVQKGDRFPKARGTGFARVPGTGQVIVNADGYPTQASGFIDFGGTVARHILGVGTTVKFGDFSLQANAEYRGGNRVYQDIGSDMTFTGSSKFTTQYGRNPFIYPNSAYLDPVTNKYVTNTNIPTKNGHYTVWVDYLQNYAEPFVTSAAFWKLRDINLSYEVPQKVIQRIRWLKAAGLSVFGRNLVVLLPNENVYSDPEFNFTTGNAQGLSTSTAGSTSPPVRQLGVSLKLTF
jgi:TonB-linked SusC/RagA family outer membrane protein